MELQVNKNRFYCLITTLIALVIVCFICCSDYNPFKDESNARGILRVDFEDGDTIEIFETKPVEVVFLVKSLLQKCSLHVESNRFFTDTCIDLKDGEVFRSNISFFDTGMHKVTLVSTRESGQKTFESKVLYAVTPLYQPELRAVAGEALHFKAVGVKDKDVRYMWSFADGPVIYSNFTPEFTENIRGVAGGTGYFSVSDMKGMYRSPECKFLCSFLDEISPVITCLNNTKGDTIVTPEKELYLGIRVKDEGVISSITMNGRKPDYDLRSGDSVDCIWNISGIDTINGVFPLVVTAIDFSSNSTTKTYLLCSDTSISSNDMIDLKISSPMDTIVKKTSVYLSGEYINIFNTGRLDTLQLLVNGEKAGYCHFTDAFLKKWNFNITAPKDVNTIRLILKGIQGDTLHDTIFNLYYNPDKIDSKAPNLVELTVDGKSVADGEHKTFDKSSVQLRLIAFDEGEGISSVTINDDLISQKDSTNYIWEDVIQLTSQYKEIRIKITDAKGFDTSLILYLNVNHRPKIQFSPSQKITVGIGKEFQGTILGDDPDGDSVYFKLASNEIETFLIDSHSGKYVWTPSRKDASVSRILINYGDKFYKDMVCTLNVTVVDTVNISQKIKLITNESDFPEKLIADSQSIVVQLKTEPNVNYKQLKYTWFKFPNDTNAKVVNGIFEWSPMALDTGEHKISITVTDTISKSSASIYPVVKVLPKKKPLKIFLDYSGKKVGESIFDLSDTSLTGTLSILIVDDDNLINDNHPIIISLGGKTENNNLVGKRFKIALDPSKQATGYDTLRFSITDMYNTYVREAILYYGSAPEKPVITQPVSGENVSGSECSFSWASSDIDSSNKLSYSLLMALPGEEFKTVLENITEKNCVYPISKVGLQFFKIAAFDGKAHSESDAISINANPGNRVRFANRPDEFPDYIEAGSNWTLLLKPEEGTGIKPFTYSVKSSGSAIPELKKENTDPDARLLVWKPSESDTGNYRLQLVISDSLKNSDILEVSIKIVPSNRIATLIPYKDGLPYEDSVLQVNGVDPDTLIYHIVDPDASDVEMYSIIIKKSNSEQHLVVGESRRFMVIINPEEIEPDSDLLIVELYERGVFSTVDSLKIVY